ncbi:MAG: serine hydrolase domain-containing protein [Planctomycetota bacterium]
MNAISIAAALLIAPLPQGGADDLTDRLAARAERALEADELDGLVVVVGVGDEVLLQKGWGRLPGGGLAAPDSVFRAGPLVEPLTALAAMRLVERGALDLDAPVGKYLEGLEWEGTELTVHHVLSHTSGLIGWADAYEAAGRGDIDIAGALELVREGGVQTPPGACFDYSESNGLVVGALVEAVSEKTLPEAIETMVLAPADLDATGFDVDGAPPARSQAACSAEIAGEQIDVVHAVHVFGEDAFCASALDLFKLGQAVHGGDAFEDAAVRRMTESKRLEDGSETGHGYGFSVSKLGDLTSLTKGGSADGTTVHIAYYPEPDVSVVLLVAAERAPLGALERDLARIVLDMPLPGVQDVRLTADEAKAFVGRYQVGCTTFEVAVREDGRLSVGVADRPNYRLLYQGRRRFVAERDPDVTFEFVVEDGQTSAQKMLIDERGRLSEAVRFQ